MNQSLESSNEGIKYISVYLSKAFRVYIIVAVIIHFGFHYNVLGLCCKAEN